MKFLITGAGGFIGSHLARHLLEQGHAVTAAMHRRGGLTEMPAGNLKTACGDLLDDSFCNKLLEEHTPDIVFHLAAQSLPQAAWQDPAHNFQNNTMAALKLFDAATRRERKPLVVFASSSSVYAPAGDGARLAETSPLRPNSIYAAGKLAVEQLAAIYGKTHGLPCIIVRPFFIIGPGKKGDVSSDLARGIARIERGETGELRAGNLSAIRDFLDIHDATAALLTAAIGGRAGETYNICSGEGHSIGKVLDILRQNTKRPVAVVVDKAKLRSIDDPVKIGDPAKIMRLGWKRSVSLEQSLAAVMAYWRTQETI